MASAPQRPDTKAFLGRESGRGGGKGEEGGERGETAAQKQMGLTVSRMMEQPWINA